MASVNMETANGTVQLATMEDLKAMQTSISNSMGGRLVASFGVKCQRNGKTQSMTVPAADYVTVIASKSEESSSGASNAFVGYQFLHISNIAKGYSGYADRNMGIKDSDMIKVSLSSDGCTLSVTGKNFSGYAADYYDFISIEAYSYT